LRESRGLGLARLLFASSCELIFWRRNLSPTSTLEWMPSDFSAPPQMDDCFRTTVAFRPAIR
jgi:hypothetical protein